MAGTRNRKLFTSQNVLILSGKVRRATRCALKTKVNDGNPRSPIVIVECNGETVEFRGSRSYRAVSAFLIGVLHADPSVKFEDDLSDLTNALGSPEYVGEAYTEGIRLGRKRDAHIDQVHAEAVVEHLRRISPTAHCNAYDEVAREYFDAPEIQFAQRKDAFARACQKALEDIYSKLEVA